MTIRRFVALASALGIGLALAACVPVPGSDGSPSPTSAAGTATPTEPPAPEPGPATAIVLSGDKVQIQDAVGTTIVAHSFTDDPAIVAASLASAIGAEPDVYEDDAPGECTAAGTVVYVWIDGDSSLTVTTASPEAVAPWDTLDVRTGARSIGDILIVTSAGFSVGDDASAFVQALPADEHQDGTVFIWDRVETYDSQPFGGTAFTDETGVVNFLGTPGLMQSWYC